MPCTETHTDRSQHIAGLYGSFCVVLGLLAALLVCLYFLLGVGRPASAKDVEAAGRPVSVRALRLGDAS